jgi:Skp family chaperone for outer membrane proteins
MEILVAVLGAAGALFIFQAFGRYSATKGQEDLKKKIAQKEADIAKLNGEISAKEKETQDKVDAITKEQEKPITTDDLVKFFNNRKH